MDIFVSYARAHESRAREVSDALRALGYSVWRDDLLPAHRLYSDIIEAAFFFKTGAETVEPRFLLPMAIVAVKSGRAEDAASILGYVDIAREIAHERASSQALANATRALISETMDDATRGRLGAEGAAMNGDAIIAVALGRKTALLVEAR